jgi:single-stranded DNA-binding protein
MNLFISIANLCRAAEDLELGGRACAKLRLADNTYGKAETRFFDAIVGGPDVETAKRLAQGDQIVIAGTLNKGSYKAKKGKMKGKMVQTEDMPFAKILQVTKSPTFFAGTGDDEAEDEGDTSEPDITEGAEDAAEEPAGENPLADLENA